MTNTVPPADLQRLSAIAAAYRVACGACGGTAHSKHQDPDAHLFFPCEDCAGSGTVQPYPDGVRSWAEKHIGWPMLVWRREWANTPYKLEMAQSDPQQPYRGPDWLPALHAVDALQLLEEATSWSYMRAMDEWGHVSWMARDEAHQDRPTVYADTPHALLPLVLDAIDGRA